AERRVHEGKVLVLADVVEGQLHSCREQRGKAARELEALPAKLRKRAGRRPTLGQPEIAKPFDDLVGDRVAVAQVGRGGAEAVGLGVEAPAVIRAGQPPVAPNSAVGEGPAPMGARVIQSGRAAVPVTEQSVAASSNADPNGTLSELPRPE